MRRVLCLMVVAVAGCGGTGGAQTSGADLTLLLGEPPSGAHAGVYLAKARSYDAAEGLDLAIRRSGDAARLLRNGRVQAALVRRGDVAATGGVCVMALVQTPLPDRFVCVTRTQLAERRADVEGLVRALQRGYSETAIDPESGAQAVLAAAPGLDPATVADEAEAAAVAAAAGVPAIGFLRRGRLPDGDFAYDVVEPTSRD